MLNDVSAASVVSKPMLSWPLSSIALNGAMSALVADLKQPMSYSDAKYLEVDVAIKLRELGYAVWQA